MTPNRKRLFGVMVICILVTCQVAESQTIRQIVSSPTPPPGTYTTIEHDRIQDMPDLHALEFITPSCLAIAAASDLYVYDIENDSLQLVLDLTEKTDAIFHLEYDESENSLLLGGIGKVISVDATTWAIKWIEDVGLLQFESFELATDGNKLILATMERDFFVIDSNTGEHIYQEDSNAARNCASISSDGAYFAIAKQGIVELRELVMPRLAEQSWSFPGFVREMEFIVVNEQLALVIATSDNEIFLMDMSQKEPLHHIDVLFGDVTTLDCTASPGFVAVGYIPEARGDSGVRLLNCETGDIYSCTHTISDMWVSSVDFSSDGKKCAAATYNFIQLWQDVGAAVPETQ